MTVEEFAEKLREGLKEEVHEIAAEQNRKGKLSGFDQGRSFECRVVEGLMIKMLRDEGKDES